jgi:hypothetical protein
VLALAVAPGATLAQTDDQTDDHAEQDRRYQERARQAEAQRKAQADDPAAQAAELLARAEKLIRDRHYRAASSARYRVETDDPRIDPEAATALLEAFRDHFDRFFAGRLELAPYDEISRVFLFYSFHDFNELLGGDWTFSLQRPKGHYHPAFDRITLHTDPDGIPALSDALLHEAAHQLVEQRIFGRGAYAPLWVGEGLASYFGHTWRDADGTFHAAELGGKSQSLLRDAPREGKSEARVSLQRFREALEASRRGEEKLAVTDVLALDDPAAFYGSEASRHYAASWLVVHWLFFGDEGRHAAAFARYLEGAAQGHGEPQALYRELGIEPAEVEAAVRAHVARLRVR